MNKANDELVDKVYKQVDEALTWLQMAGKSTTEMTEKARLLKHHAKIAWERYNTFGLNMVATQASIFHSSAAYEQYDHAQRMKVAAAEQQLMAFFVKQ